MHAKSDTSVCTDIRLILRRIKEKKVSNCVIPGTYTVNWLTSSLYFFFLSNKTSCLQCILPPSSFLVIMCILGR